MMKSVISALFLLSVAVVDAVDFSSKCDGGDVCTIPEGEEWVLDKDIDLNVLIVK
eukprot:Pgem_evm1s18226